MQTAQIASDTERTVREFIRSAVSQLSETLRTQPTEAMPDLRWKRGDDGNFREVRQLIPAPRILTDEWLQSVPRYAECVEHLRSDAVVGPHLGRLVGDSMMRFHIEPDMILLTAIHAMANPAGAFRFSEDRFDEKWREFTQFFCADTVRRTLIAPLPRLNLPFPLRLNDELTIDRLTEAEVTRCCQGGVLRPSFPRFPVIDASMAVGIRRITSLPKIIVGDNEQQAPELHEEGRFGNRPILRDDLVIADVLAALRLLKPAQLSPLGSVRWTEAPWLTGTTFGLLRQLPFGGQCDLSIDEVTRFVELWQLLEQADAAFGFIIHRFNLAFERGLIADRIVDLVIAAESLFLRDIDSDERGELSFRLALRVAKFIEFPGRTEHDVFRLMRRAYKARSRIVHGGETGAAHSAEIATYIDDLETVVRLALRKAVAIEGGAALLRQPKYWESLVFATPIPELNRESTGS